MPRDRRGRDDRGRVERSAKPARRRGRCARTRPAASRTGSGDISERKCSAD
jgi:hypothetical protein